MAGLESLLAGRLLGGRYRVERVIGRGGMGAVYQATDERLGRPVAAKVITAASADEEARERVRARFRREAGAAARLPHHPNVVPVYDYGTDEELGLDYLVMELLHGEDVASRLARTGPPPLGAALRILLGAARGVAVGHRSGLVHRDVKPGNLFLARSDEGDEVRVRVVDFGIAKAIEEEDTATALTQDGRAPLSPAYASPEQLRGDTRLTPASDVFSLGAVAFQLLTGERPFSEADRGRMAAGLDVPVPSLRSRNPAVPDDVEAIVRRALAHDAAERYADAGTMAEALQGAVLEVDGAPREVAAAVPLPRHPPVEDDATALVGDDDEHDRTALAPEAAAAAAAETEPAPEPVAKPAIPPSRRRRREEKSGTKRVVMGVLGVAALGAAGLVAMEAMDGGGSRPTPVVEVDDTAAVEDSVEDVETPEERDGPRAIVLNVEGLRLYRQGEYAAALDRFRRAVEIKPDSAPYHDHLGAALLAVGEPGDAEEAFEEALRLDPNLYVAWSHLADARLAQADTSGAVAALEEFVGRTLEIPDRRRAQARIRALTAPQPVITPTPSIDTSPAGRTAPGDTIRLGRQAPGDTLRLGGSRP